MKDVTEFRHKLERRVSLGSIYFETLLSEIFQTFLKSELIIWQKTSTQEEKNGMISKIVANS